MSLIDVVLPKRYRNGRILFEQNLDAWRLATTQGFATVNLNLTQIGKDIFGPSYDFHNDGTAFLPLSLQDQINAFLGGTAVILGTSSLTFTINSLANFAQLTAIDLTAGRTFTFPDVSGHFAILEANQTFTGVNTFSAAPLFNSGITLPSLQRVNLNVGGTTYIAEAAPGEFGIFTGGGGARFTVSNTAAAVDSTIDFQIASTRRAIFNGSTASVWIDSPSPNVLRLVTNSIEGLRITAGNNIEIFGSVTMNTNQSLSFDAGNLNFWRNSGVGQNDFYSNSILTLRTTSSGAITLPAVALETGQGGTGVRTFTSNGILYGNAAGNVLVTAQGAAGTVLHGNGGAPSFSQVDLTADVTGILPFANGGSGSFTTGSILFAGGTGLLAQDNANLFWDDALNLAGFGTNTPNSRIHVLGGTTATSTIRIQHAGAGTAILALENPTMAWNVGATAIGNFSINDNGGSAIDRLLIASNGSYISFNVGGSTSTATYTTTGRAHAASGTTVTVGTVPLPNSNTGCFIMAKIAGKRWGAAQACEYFVISASAHNNAGALAVSAVTTIANGTTGASTLSAVNMVASGTDILIQATADVGFDVDCVATTEWQIAIGS